MYSDRVDSVTRATNPTLLPKPSLHSSRSPRSSASTTIGSTFLSLSFSRHLLSSCVSMPIPSSRFPYSLTASRPIFLLLIPLRPYPDTFLDVSSIISSSHTIFLSLARLLSLCFFCYSISLRLVISHLGNSRMQSRSRMTEMPRNVSKVTIKLIIRDIGISYGSNRGIRVQPFFRICDQLDTRSRRRKRRSSSPFFLSSS